MKIPALNMNSQKSFSYVDLGSDTNYTEITLCMKANFRSFYPEAYNALFSLSGVKKFAWSMAIFEPFHSMRNLGKQVLG